jgi:hypothetical protein
MANKLNLFNQIGIINILCYGNIVGYENEYISGLKNINPSEAILIDMLLNKKGIDTRESSSSQAYLSTDKQRENGKFKSSVLNIFDDKIAALNTAKNHSVDKEDYVEAEKLKQIIMKIEKLKTYIKRLEEEKLEHARNEDYDKAKSLKNEIDKIKNIVLSITSGTTRSRPKIMPTMVNPQKRVASLNKSTASAADYSHTMNTFGKFKSKQEAQEASMNAYGYTEPDTITFRKHSLGTMKNSYKRSGILKVREDLNDSNLDTSFISNKDHSNINSTVNLSYNEEPQDPDESYFSSAKKHVRIVDPKSINNR